jgi:lipopolysaccharide heptosyltransferase I
MSMPEPRFLIVRLSSMGDILHTLPAVSALRASFPAARLDWLVADKWRPLVAAIAGLDAVISFRQSSWSDLRRACSEMRRAEYDCAIDFQGLYKSALLAQFSGAPRRVGFGLPNVRERGAAFFYSERVVSSAAHVIDQNLALAGHLGARVPGPDPASMFPLRISAQDDAYIAGALAASGLREFFALSPGGGWTSKCWPPERYGELHRRLARGLGYSGVVSFGPGERALAESLRRAAGDPAPLLLEMDVPQLMAALRRAKVFIGGDSGPLHLAVGLGTPVVGIYGPTDPARNGPYFPENIAIRNAGPAETTHHRGTTISPAMLSVSVDQVEDAVVRRVALSAPGKKQ